MLNRVTDAVSEPVTIDDVKASLILSGADDDTLIEGYIKEARQRVEDFAHISLLAQVWELTLGIDALSSHITLPRPPITKINSIKYTTSDGLEHDFDTEAYFLDTFNECVRLKVGYAWTRVATYDVLFYTIQYETGYAVVPEGFKRAIVLVAHQLYEQRPDAELVPIMRKHVPERRRLL